jgi:hypothetical protein
MIRFKMIYYESIDHNKHYILCSFQLAIIKYKNSMSINQQNELIIIVYKIIEHDMN